MSNCFFCGKELHKRRGFVKDSEYYGPVRIPEAEYYQCDCGRLEIPSQVLRQVEEEESRLRSRLLLQRLDCIDDINRQYLKNSELVRMLGISRQAIAQNKHLHNLVFHIRLFGQRYYLRKSVELFKDCGDGRFPLFTKSNSRKKSAKPPILAIHS